MPLCTITYNASSGSDTAASGSNAPTTAVTGTNGDISGTTFTLNETVDFTGVNDDGSDVLWVDTPSGDRHLYRITAFNGGVSTCTTLTVTPSAGTARTGDNWAVGGRRQTPDNDTSQTDVEDAQAGWRYEYEAGTYTYGAGNITLPSVGDSTNGPVEWVAASGASPTVEINEDGNFRTFIAEGTDLYLEGLTMVRNQTTPWTGSSLFRSSSTDSRYTVVNCDFTSPAQNFELVSTCSTLVAEGSQFTSTDLIGISFGNRGGIFAIGCRFYDCAQEGVRVASSTNYSHSTFVGCVFDGNGQTGSGFDALGDDSCVEYYNCVFHNNTDDGLGLLDATYADGARVVVRNCIFTDNGGYGINASSTAWDNATAVYADHNAFYNNTSGARNNVMTGPNDVTLTADPYTNASGNIYTLNDDAGGGRLLKRAGTGYTP